MNAVRIAGESNGNQNEHHDQNYALFVFRELENPEQAFHFPLGGLKAVILSGAKNLRLLFVRANGHTSQRCFALLNMTRRRFIFLRSESDLPFGLRGSL
jgi:hypothetical protein